MPHCSGDDGIGDGDGKENMGMAIAAMVDVMVVVMTLLPPLCHYHHSLPLCNLTPNLGCII